MAGQSKEPTVAWETQKYVQGVVRHVRRMENLGERDVKATGIKVHNWAKLYSPVKTGRMKNSIKWEEGRDERGYFIAIICTATYWKFVEFGHRIAHTNKHKEPQPFMRPAFVQGLLYLKSLAERNRR